VNKWTRAHANNIFPTSVRFLSALLIALCGLCPQLACTQPAREVPRRMGHVTDTAGILSPGDHALFEDALANYESETHHQVAVLIVPSLAGERIDSFSLRVARTWRLGYAGWDDGILVTLAVNEREVRIELGSGMERYISHSTAREIIDHAMVPAFKKRDYAGGLRAGLSRLMEQARTYRIQSVDIPPNPESHP
jgi:uncharacterized protein